MRTELNHTEYGIEYLRLVPETDLEREFIREHINRMLQLEGSPITLSARECDYAGEGVWTYAATLPGAGGPNDILTARFNVPHSACVVRWEDAPGIGAGFKVVTKEA